MTEPDTHDNDVDDPIDEGAAPQAQATAEIERLTSERDEAQARYQRALADFQNFQRRAYANEEAARLRAKADVVRDLVPALENLDLVLEQEANQDAARAIQQGVKMVRDEMLKALAGHGVSRIEPKAGDEFDPNRHEALMHIDAPDVAPDRVAQVFKAGYTLGQIIIRPAKVTLARAAE